MDKWSIWWLAWFLTTLLTFGVAEAWALISGNPGDTLSAQVWKLLDVIEYQPLWQWNAAHLLGAGVILVFLGWLSLHLALGIWR